MPYLERSTYKAPRWFWNNHVQTIYPALFRQVNPVSYIRERIDLWDGDFLDIDWSRIGEKRLVLLCHGLEGSSDATYIRGMVEAANNSGWDAVAMNYRGCSGELNRLARSYHSGATEDLSFIIDHILSLQYYDEVVLVGYSLGGNLVIKYLGETGEKVDSRITKGVAFSVPCDLASGARNLARRKNYVYMRRFLSRFRVKIDAKRELLEAAGFDVDAMKRSKSFLQFDNHYTAPAHGFNSAEHYWAENSCDRYIPGIKVPTLLVNAYDDPFLTKACFPIQEARDNEYFHLEVPRFGGHVGFVDFNQEKMFWSERRVLGFIN